MKHCVHCDQKFETEKFICPKCGEDLVESIGWGLGFVYVMIFLFVMYCLGLAC